MGNNRRRHKWGWTELQPELVFGPDPAVASIGRYEDCGVIAKALYTECRRLGAEARFIPFGRG